MYLVGLTGGVSSGKSTVSKFFKELGAFIIDADKIAHELTEPDTPVWQKIIDYFGPKAVHSNKQLNRKYIADKIYNSDEMRLALNAITHPAVIDEIGTQIKQISQSHPEAIIIADIPLLFEVELPFKWNKIITVFVTKTKQFERILAEGLNLDKTEFEKRLRSQLPLEEKNRMADLTIDNNGTLEETKQQVIKIYNQLRQESGRHSS